MIKSKRFRRNFIAFILFVLNTSFVMAQTREEKKKLGTSYQNQSRVSGYPIKNLLKETDEYKLYGAEWLTRTNDAGVWAMDWCSQNVDLSLVFKKGENLVINNDDNYWKRFETELLPFITSQCPDFITINVHNFVEGYQIYYGQKVLSREVDSDRTSDPIGVAVYSPQSSGKRRRRWFYGPLPYDPRNATNLSIDSDLTSIAKIQEAWKGNIDLVAVEKKRRKEEELERKRENSRVLAASILGLYKKGAGKNYSFNGYSQQRSLQNIYAGNFEPFTGGYEKNIISETLKAQVSLYASRAPLDDVLAENNRLTALIFNITQLRESIMIAYFAYHQAYEQQCSMNKELRWIVATKQIDGDDFKFSVREPFYETFFKSINSGTDSFTRALFTGTPLSTRAEFQNDFIKFLKVEGCSSATVRHMEVNLYLAAEWLLPLQNLVPAELLESPNPPAQKPANTQKPKTVVKKPSKNYL